MSYKSRAFLRLDRVKVVTDAWWNKVPYIQPYYAIKSFPNTDLIKFLHEQKFKFDCASKGEIKLVARNSPGDQQIIFSNPVKSPADITYARNKNVNLLVVDSVEEVEKIHKINKKAQFILRVTGHESNSVIRFNNKFGADSNKTAQILNYIGVNNLKFAGYSYHVGSQCHNMDSHRITINKIIDYIHFSNALGLRTKLIDIGGGFENINQLAELNRIYNKYFRYMLERNNIELIAEPGRLIAAPSLDIVVKVIAVSANGPNYKVTVNDSIYHSFQGAMYDSQKFNPILINHQQSPKKSPKNSESVHCVIFGQTCDSLDIICKTLMSLPKIGDYIMFSQMGAYSLASAGGKFNGFEAAQLNQPN